jgi:serine/threonine protein kinase
METPVKFKIQSKLCETTSSNIYKGILISSIVPDITPVIIKMDKVTSPITNYLLNETKMRRFLEKVQCIPKLLDYGIYNNKRYIVYPFIPEALQYHRFYTDTALYTGAFQLLTMIEDIHKHGIIHCDISTNNILYDREKDKYYINDFGQAKHYTFAIEERGNNPTSGCPLFCSENIHKGYECTPRDDLISIGYLLLYCYKGTLPWSGLKTCKTIYNKKVEFRQTYYSQTIPDDLKTYLNYCFHLGINEKPKYNLLKKMFDTVKTNIDKEQPIYT